MAEYLGLLSLAISAVALINGLMARRMMRAIANLEYDEKLAIMADHLLTLRNRILPETVDRALSDFRAVSNLMRYGSAERKQRLIRDYVIPIIRTCVEGNPAGGVAVVVNEMIDLARAYGVDADRLEEFRQRLRGA